jgi:polyhydroxyalkanoate synthesis regulator phasin
MIMSERTKLLKKAVLTSVGASTNVDRIKSALNDAMQDLVKVGQILLEDLEEKGKVKTDTVQDFLKNLQSEAYKKTSQVEKQVSSKVQKTVRELGLITQEDLDEICERLTDIEEAVGIGANSDGNGGHSGEKRRSRRKKHSS